MLQAEDSTCTQLTSVPPHALPKQAAPTLSAVLFGSAFLFAYHCGQGQLALASLQPPLIYSALALLFIPLPLKFLFPVRSAAAAS